MADYVNSYSDPKLFKLIWAHVDEVLLAHDACRYIVRLLHLAASQDCETALGRYVLKEIELKNLPTALQCAKRFGDAGKVIPLVAGSQHPLADYDELLGEQEVKHG